MELFKIHNIFTDPVCVLKVINSTPEPDGSYKEYYLTVPPDMTSAKQAVAWTFRMTPEEYSPSQET
jgi:YHS domain-containing protein